MSYLDLVTPEKSLRARVKIYRKRAREIEQYLEAHPNEWGRFQSEFNQEINGIFRDLMLFEKENLLKGREDKVYKLKQLFIKRFRSEFARGEYIVWSLTKPYGYAGDFKIIDDIYRNDPRTWGVDRLFDNYAQMSAVAISIRNRKEDFKKLISSFVASCNSIPIRMMDLASGPGRVLMELFQGNGVRDRHIVVDCYDQDSRAILYSKGLLKPYLRSIRFVQENAIRLALKRDLDSAASERYDLIYSTGLFDYLADRIASRLITNLRKLLKEGGRLMIANVTEKCQNPSVYFLEWVGDWNLIYRKAEEFKKIFVEAGFRQDHLELFSEQQGIMQYMIAKT